MMAGRAECLPAGRKPLPGNNRDLLQEVLQPGAAWQAAEQRPAGEGERKGT
jgi:hypothetical protein